MPCEAKNLKGPEKKEPSSSNLGVRQWSSGQWKVEIRNPLTKRLTKRREYSLYDTEEAADAAYQARKNQFRAEMLAMKAQLPVSEHAALSSLSSVSCVSSSVPCQQKAQEAQNRIFMETDPEPMDESLLNSPTPKEISVDALVGRIDELPVSDSFSLADKLPLDDNRLEDVFQISDFIGATHGPLDDDYIGHADISHLPLPFKDPEFDLDAELDWTVFDLASIEDVLKVL